MHNMQRAAIAAAALLVLAGCSEPPLPPPGVDYAAPTAMVESIRAIKANDHSVVQVVPLRNPSVDGLLAKARAFEHRTQYRDELAAINAALQLSPDAPDLLQWRAETEILLRDYPAADADARRSYVLGPKVGGLCASNWQTVLKIAQLQKDQAGVAAARTKRDACNKPGPVRM